MFTISSSDDETNIPYSPISSQPTRYIYDSMQIFFGKLYVLLHWLKFTCMSTFTHCTADHTLSLVI